MSKKSKMLLLSLVVLLVMSIAVVGCNGTTEPAPEQQEEPSGDTEPAPEQQEEPSADTDVAAEEPVELAALSPAEGDFIPGTSITFRWEATECAENYRIRIVRQSDGTVFYNRLTESTKSSYTVSNFLDDGEIYCWQVSMLNAEGWSDWSDNNCFTNSDQ